MHGKVTAEEFGFKQMMNPLRAILGQWVFAERKKAFESVRWIQSFGLKVLEDLLTKEEGGRRLHQGLCDLSDRRQSQIRIKQGKASRNFALGHTMATTLY